MPPRRLNHLAAASLAAMLMTGCASTPGIANDPFEPANRAIFGFNDAVDKAIAEPIAKGYKSAIPAPLRKIASNFFSNLDDAWSGINNALQGRGQETSDSIGRFMINTTIGLGGLIDVASDLGIDRHPQDFGKTLGRWGVPSGPYLVLPLIGSSSFRDAAGLPVDYKFDLANTIDPLGARDAALAIRAVDARAQLLSASELLEQAALDRYAFMRDAYLQRRGDLVPEDFEASDQNDPPNASPASTAEASPSQPAVLSSGEEPAPAFEPPSTLGSENGPTDQPARRLGDLASPSLAENATAPSASADSSKDADLETSGSDPISASSGANSKLFPAIGRAISGLFSAMPVFGR